MAREAGIIELFHGVSEDDPQSGFVLCHGPLREKRWTHSSQKPVKH
jgi:hypothetical protein